MFLVLLLSLVLLVLVFFVVFSCFDVSGADSLSKVDFVCEEWAGGAICGVVVFCCCFVVI